MKNFPIVLVLACLVMVMTACEKETISPAIQPSEKITTEEKDITGFNKLVAANEFEVFITFSYTEEKVEVEANENLQDLIIIEKSGKTLELKMKPNTTIKGDETIKIHIVTQEIIDFKLAGEVEVTMSNELITNDVVIELAGESRIMGPVDVNGMTARMAGEAALNLSGQAKTVNLTTAGDAKVKDYDFVCQKLEAELAGESEVFLTVTETIDVSAAGESVLHFKGTGEITNQTTTGEAKVIKED